MHMDDIITFMSEDSASSKLEEWPYYNPVLEAEINRILANTDIKSLAEKATLEDVNSLCEFIEAACPELYESCFMSSVLESASIKDLAIAPAIYDQNELNDLMVKIKAMKEPSKFVEWIVRIVVGLILAATIYVTGTSAWADPAGLLSFSALGRVFAGGLLAKLTLMTPTALLYLLARFTHFLGSEVNCSKEEKLRVIDLSKRGLEKSLSSAVQNNKGKLAAQIKDAIVLLSDEEERVKALF